MQPDIQNDSQEVDNQAEKLGMYQPEQDNNDEFKAPEQQQASPHKDDEQLVRWNANEYISEEKNALWYVIFGLVIIAFIAIDYYLLKEFTFSILVVVMAVSVVVLAKRPPRNIEYTISGSQGLYIGEKLYHFNDFKAFGLIKDREHHSIMLIPIKRFSPGVSVYFPEEAGEKIVDILGARLPMESLKLDMIDILVRKLRL